MAFTEGLPDWGCLDGCFGNTRISPTDVDGLVERRGALLMLEWKRPGGQLREGQRLALLSLSKIPRCAAIVVWGATQPAMAPERMQVFWDGQAQDTVDADIGKVREAVSRWFDMANRDEAPPPKADDSGPDEAHLARLRDREKPSYLARISDSRESFETLLREYCPSTFLSPRAPEYFWLVEERRRA